MAEILLQIHSIVRWLLLAVLAAVAVYGFVSASRQVGWSPAAARPFSWALLLMDIQVLIGILVWITGRAWKLGAFRAWIHPAGILIALGVGHALAGRAKKTEGSAGYRLSAVSLLAVLVIVAVTIPRDAWF